MKKLFSIVLLFCNLTSLAQISDSLNKTNTLNKTIKEVLLEKNLISSEEIDELLNIEKLI